MLPPRAKPKTKNQTCNAYILRLLHYYEMPSNKLHPLIMFGNLVVD